VNPFDLGPHAAFIVWSYFITFAVLGGLIGWVLLDGCAQRRKLAALEARGIKRRSSGGTP
jgi:heme exporter protein D